jgi:hypothetical protein
MTTTDNSESKSNRLPRALEYHLRALTRFVLVQTEEEYLLIESFARALPEFLAYSWVFNQEYGLRPIAKHIEQSQNGSCYSCSRSESADSNPSDRSTHNAMDTIVEHKPKEYEYFYLLTDPEVWFEDAYMVRRLINLAMQLLHHDQDKCQCLIFIGHPSVKVPAKLLQFFEVVEYNPNDPWVLAEVEKTARETMKLAGMDPQDDLSLFHGLTSYEVDSVIAQNVVMTKEPGIPCPNPHLDSDVVGSLREARLTLRGSKSTG